MQDSKSARTKQRNLKSIVQGKAKDILRLVFVHNIGYKLLAIGTALVCWFLTVWLN